MRDLKDHAYLASVAAAAAEMATIPNRAPFTTGAPDMTGCVERGPARIAFDRAANTLSYDYRVIFTLDSVEYDFLLSNFLTADGGRRKANVQSLVSMWANHPRFPISLVVARFGNLEHLINGVQAAYQNLVREEARIHQKHGIE